MFSRIKDFVKYVVTPKSTYKYVDDLFDLVAKEMQLYTKDIVALVNAIQTLDGRLRTIEVLLMRDIKHQHSSIDFPPLRKEDKDQKPN